MRSHFSTCLSVATAVALLIGTAARAEAHWSDEHPAGGGPVAHEPAAAAAQSASRWHYFPSRPEAPHGAPNVLLIMTDDEGFAASSTFGGPVPTPVLDQLAQHGVKYNAFHTTAMCSPTRAALLTGRNHHSVGFGVIAELSTDAPGYDAYIPKSDGTIARVLKDDGYDTAWFGKNHNTPPWEATPIGPFDQWPNAMGFDYFYGFNAALTNQFKPDLVENRTEIAPPDDPDYILDHDLADHALHWLQNHQTLDPGHPFFLYYAPGATHAPHQAPRAWIEKFKGQFTQGWDKVREESFARQKALGIIPADAKLTPRPPQMPAWDSLSADEKTVAARLMQVYAAMLAYDDDQIGRVIEELRRSGQLENTLILYIEGDNGAAAENLNGTSDTSAVIGGIEGSYPEMLHHLDELGGPKSFESYPVGWAWSLDTPFQWSKEVASHFGGMRNGLVISWPGHMSDPGEVRPQFHHVIDIAPTIYEAAHITPPAQIDGVKQTPLQGVSMLYTLEHPRAPSTHHSQYFEMLGNRAFYEDGWIASTTPGNMPWDHHPKVSPDEFKWELYDLHHDYSQANDLAARYPAKLAQMKADFAAAAKEFNVLPIDGNPMGRFNPDLRPGLTQGRTHFEYHAAQTRYSNGEIPNLNRNWHLTAQIEVPAGSASGMLAVRGDWFGGWGLFLNQGRPTFAYRASDRDSDVFQMQSPTTLGAGRHTIRVELRHDAAHRGQGDMALTVDGAGVAHGPIARFGFANGDMFVGRLGYVPLLEGLTLPRTFEGTIESATLDLDSNSSPVASP